MNKKIVILVSLILPIQVSLGAINFEPQKFFEKLYTKQKEENPCRVPGLEGEQPDMVCSLVKNLHMLHHYGDHQGEIPSFFVFYGKQGSGKTVAANWVAQESGGEKIVISPQYFLDNPGCISAVFEKAQKEAEKNNRPTVIIFEHPTTYKMTKEQIREWESYVNTVQGMWDIYHHNPYIITIFLYPDFSTVLRWDVLTRCAGIQWDSPQSETRKKILHAHLPQKHQLLEQDIDQIVFWTHGLSGGQLIKLLEHAQQIAQHDNQELTVQALHKALRKTLWREYVRPYKNEISVGTGLFLAALTYLILHKKFPECEAKIKELFTKLQQEKSPHEQSSTTNSGGQQGNN